jgi:mono/diheme cytochrome c family protein
VANAPLWEKVIRKLRTGAMPPAGMPRPDEATYNAVATYLEAALDDDAAENLDPGRPAIHRLNRTEYINAIRDLLAVDANLIDIEGLLPADDASYGFDNIGDVLTVSPVLMEGYLSAARKISRVAIGDPSAAPASEKYEQPRFLIQSDRLSEDLPLGSRGGISFRHHFPLDAEYDMRIELQRNGFTYVLGTEFPRRLDVLLNGEKIAEFALGGDFEGERPLEPSSFNQGPFEQYLLVADQHLQFRFPAEAGTHLVQITFPNHVSEPEGVFQPPVTDYAYALDYGHPDTEPAIASATIGGPFNAVGLSDTESRRRIFVCEPDGAAVEQACAREILSALARKAFRRPVVEADIQDVMALYDVGRGSGDFEAGIQLALQRILVDPEFLFRIEKDPPAIAPGTAYELSDLELASRLSFFLWSSIPDEELLSLAESERLREPEVLEAQVRRMLTDARASALVDNFAGQWLYLRNVEMVWPNPDFFPDFDANLRESFRRESELFVESIIREDKSVLELLSADYTFVNERLARHYGIPGIYGSHLRRVSLADENRHGLLGQGSILTVTSYATRTAPTIRGKWLLENILGAPPPPPPADVPSLDETAGANGEELTVRELMEMHRSNPVCASCHRVMDPLGFALENFDATGRWRMEDGGNPIDASGVTPDGFALNGPADLRAYLLSHPEQFVTTTTEKMMTYALGRGVEYYDQPAVRRIIREAEADNYSWSSIVLGVVNSVPFQMRRSEGS